MWKILGTDSFRNSSEEAGHLEIEQIAPVTNTQTLEQSNTDMLMLGQSSPLHVLECFVEWGIANMDEYDVAQSFEQPYMYIMQPLIHCSHMYNGTAIQR